MQHLPYDKISETSNDWIFPPNKNKQIQKIKWVVTEKIHGANFAIIYDGTSIAYAKRRELLSEQNSIDFYGFNRDELLTQKLNQVSEEIKVVFQQLKAKEENIRSIHFFCELFGGFYPRVSEEVLSLFYINLLLSSLIIFIFFSFRLIISDNIIDMIIYKLIFLII